jgi:glycosyltransferase involved in cell wall biosynthesis
VRIALVAPLVAPIDDRSAQLGGAQALLADLAGGLTAAGHEVDLVAASGSRVRGVRVVDLGIDAARLASASFYAAAPRTDDAAQRDAFARVRSWVDARAGAIDAVHAHAYDAAAFDALEGTRVPVVHTLHLPPVDASVVAAARRARATLATISHATASAWSREGVGIAAVVPNGIDVASVPLGRGDGGYLLSAGRIAPEKGVDAAARVARAVGLPLHVVGGVYDDAARRAIDPAGVVFLGPRPREEVFRIMARAAALLMPVRWDEPFGLVAVEAMAAGTPVVAYRRGGLAEVIDDGRTGYLVEPDDEDALVDAARRVDGIDRAACRARVERCFTLERMVTAYCALYARL